MNSSSLESQSCLEGFKKYFTVEGIKAYFSKESKQALNLSYIASVVVLVLISSFAIFSIYRKKIFFLKCSIFVGALLSLFSFIRIFLTFYPKMGFYSKSKNMLLALVSDNINGIFASIICFSILAVVLIVPVVLGIVFKKRSFQKTTKVNKTILLYTFIGNFFVSLLTKMFYHRCSDNLMTIALPLLLSQAFIFILFVSILTFYYLNKKINIVKSYLKDYEKFILNKEKCKKKLDKTIKDLSSLVDFISNSKFIGSKPKEGILESIEDLINNSLSPCSLNLIDLMGKDCESLKEIESLVTNSGVEKKLTAVDFLDLAYLKKFDLEKFITKFEKIKKRNMFDEHLSGMLDMFLNYLEILNKKIKNANSSNCVSIFEEIRKSYPSCFINAKKDENAEQTK